MQLRLQRSQRAGGVLGKTVFFCLDVRGDYSPDEQDNIRKYELGGQVIYNSRTAAKHLESAGAHLDRTQEGDMKNRTAGLARGVVSLAMAKMSLNISIASLGRGHHIECKDLDELLEAEDTVRERCKSVTRYLETAATFNGSEIVIDYVNGEEKMHIAQTALPLIEYAPPKQETPEVSDEPEPQNPFDNQFAPLSAICRESWLRFEQKIIVSAATRGFSLSELQVRIGSVVASVLAFYLLIKIL